MGASIAFLLLTKNEEHAIASALRGLRHICETQGWENVGFFLADDSHDATRIIAEREGATIIAGDGKGLGSAYRAGLEEVLRHAPDLIVTLDGDGQTELSEIPRFIAIQRSTRADLVLGSRFQNKDLVQYTYRKRNRLGTWLLSHYLTWMTGQKITDSHGGIRVITPRAAQGIKIYGAHTYVQESIVDIHERGMRIVEIPSVWKKREQGQSRVVHSIGKYILRVAPFLALRAMLRLRPRWN